MRTNARARYMNAHECGRLSCCAQDMMLLFAPMGKSLEEVKAMDDTDTTLYIDRC